MKKHLIAFALASALFLFSGCGEQSSAPQGSANTSPAAINFPSELKSIVSEFTGTALNKLSDVGTFLHDSSATIPLPKEISDLSSSLKAAGQGALLERLSGSIQESAANAIQEVKKPLEGILEKVSFDDAMGLITGSDDAITRQIESTTREQFETTLKPAIANALEKTGASDIIETIKEKGKQASGALSALKGLGVKAPNLDLNLDAYVNGQIVDRIFSKMAEEEKKLREDPQGRLASLYTAAKEKISAQ